MSKWSERFLRRSEIMAFQSNQQLVRSVEETTDAIRQLVNGVAQDQVTCKPSEQDWSILEHICHLRDIEQEGYTARVEKILSHDRPFLADLDGDKLAAERDYNHQPFDRAWQSFIAARENNLRTFRDLSDEQMSRSAMFENVGVITLAQLIRMMGEHDREHLQQLGALSPAGHKGDQP
jgi:DinB superfamily